MATITDIWEGAPKEATHYSQGNYYTSFVYWLIEDGIVKKAWVEYDIELCTGEWYEDQGYSCVDYTPDAQPIYDKDKLITRPTQKWTPDTGEIVLFKRTDSIDYAYDSPEKMEVVAIVGDKVWLKNALRDLVTNLDNISPLEKEKSLREELVKILSYNGQQQYVDAYLAADRLIEAGIKLKEE